MTESLSLRLMQAQTCVASLTREKAEVEGAVYAAASKVDPVVAAASLLTRLTDAASATNHTCRRTNWWKAWR
jgi:hypothetical protein